MNPSIETLAQSVTPAFVVVVGLLIFWANPKRGVNRSVSTVSLAVAAWLACSHFAVASESNGLVWLKLTYAAGGLVPLTLWRVKRSILAPEGTTGERASPMDWAWYLGTCALVVVPFLEIFIPAHSTEENRIRGWGYNAYYAGLLVGYGWILRGALTKMKVLQGARKLELQLWLCGGCVVAVTIYLLIGLSVITGNPLFRDLKPLTVLIFYAGTGFAITTHRIFDARQILLVGLEKVALFCAVAATIYLTQWVFGRFVSGIPLTLAVSLVAVWASLRFNEWLDHRFDFFPKGITARQAALVAAQRESRIETLEASFHSVLKGWGQTDKVMILTGSKGALSGGGIEVSADEGLLGTMRVLRWATPERLARERGTPERAAVARFLAAHQLGVLVIGEGPSLTALIGVGVTASRIPFTYPQVTQLLELASIMESALERAHFSQKVQHTEQLATVGLLGASLAHEIRNPLVSIKTFVQLLPTHHQDPRFREKFFKLIGDEVTRIDQLTEQLLDLASPRTYEAKLIELHPLLRSSLDLVAAKASHRNVRFLTEFEASPDAAFTDASAAKQVMLNLCFNAIQAVETHAGAERWVKIATRNTPGGIEMAVADSGPGIAPEIRPKLFQPFQTTKSSGFGLGLAICSDILSNLHASISVDPPEPGHGATFRVTFPCQPLSS